RLLDVQRAGQAQAEKAFIEAPRLLGIAAAIGVVVEALDHGSISSRGWAAAAPPPQCVLYGGEVLGFHLLGEALDDLVDLGRPGPLMHRREPARDIGIGLEVAADQLADLDDGEAEIIGDGDVVATKILLVADEMV